MSRVSRLCCGCTRAPLNKHTGEPENTWLRALVSSGNVVVVQKAFKFEPSAESVAFWLDLPPQASGEPTLKVRRRSGQRNSRSVHRGGSEIRTRTAYGILVVRETLRSGAIEHVVSVQRRRRDLERWRTVWLRGEQREEVAQQNGPRRVSEPSG